EQRHRTAAGPRLHMADEGGGIGDEGLAAAVMVVAAPAMAALVQREDAPVRLQLPCQRHPVARAARAAMQCDENLSLAAEVEIREFGAVAGKGLAGDHGGLPLVVIP